MLKIIRKNNGQLEFAMTGHLTTQDFEEIINVMKSSVKKGKNTHILLDLRTMKGHDKIFEDKTGYFESMKNNIGRVGIVTSAVSVPVFLEYIKIISDDYKLFDAEDLNKAREWVFGKPRSSS